MSWLDVTIISAKCTNSKFELKPHVVVVGIFKLKKRSLIVIHEPIKMVFEISEMMIDFSEDKNPQQSIYIKV